MTKPKPGVYEEISTGHQFVIVSYAGTSNGTDETPRIVLARCKDDEVHEGATLHVAPDMFDDLFKAVKS